MLNKPNKQTSTQIPHTVNIVDGSHEFLLNNEGIERLKNWLSKDKTKLYELNFTVNFGKNQ